MASTAPQSFPVSRYPAPRAILLTLYEQPGVWLTSSQLVSLTDSSRRVINRGLDELVERELIDHRERRQELGRPARAYQLTPTTRALGPAFAGLAPDTEKRPRIDRQQLSQNILAFLHARQASGTKASELLEALGAARSSTNDALTLLVKMGLVEFTKAPPSDGVRAVHLYRITGQGSALAPTFQIVTERQ